MGIKETWKDTLGCAAIVAAILLGSVAGLTAICNDVLPVAAVAIAFID